MSCISFQRILAASKNDLTNSTSSSILLKSTTMCKSTSEYFDQLKLASEPVKRMSSTSTGYTQSVNKVGCDFRQATSNLSVEPIVFFPEFVIQIRLLLKRLGLNLFLKA